MLRCMLKNFMKQEIKLAQYTNRLLSRNFISILWYSESEIIININYTRVSTHDAPPDKYTLDLVQITNNKSIYHNLSYEYDGGLKSIHLENLQSGVENTFFGYLSSCGLSVTASPLITTVTIPNPLVKLEAVAIVVDGFEIHWRPPDIHTDPLIESYSYHVKSTLEEKDEYFKFETNNTYFTTTNLLPQTKYVVLVYSNSHNTSSRDAALLHLTTSSHECNNLNDLPEKMYIHNFYRNEQDVLVANLSCVRGYDLIGNSIISCNDPNDVTLPRCESIACYIPGVNNAIVTNHFNNDENKPIFGDTVTWKCDRIYEVSINITTFSSTCHQGHIWVPPLEECNHLLPQCQIDSLSHGSVSPTEVYAGQTVTYSCDHGFALVGPMVKECSQTYYGTVLIPYGESYCQQTHCSSLIPQTNGKYSKNSPPYFEDNTVTLSCDVGYYAINSYDNPDEIEYKCTSRQWNPNVELCKSMITSIIIDESMLVIQAEFTWSFSAWNGIIMENKYHKQGCIQLGGNGIFESHGGNIIECQRSIELARGPTNFDGILTYNQGKEKSEAYVCIDSVILAKEICDHMGYSGYTASIYHSTPTITNTVVDGNSIDSGKLKNSNRLCYRRISCKAKCEPLDLLDGSVRPQEQPYELDVYHFTCQNGYYLSGETQRQCTANGWTGTETFCDGMFNTTYFSLWD